MKLKIYAVRDSATEQFANPMFMLHDNQAIRGFMDEVNRAEQGNMINQHNDDFDLYALGEYETDTGEFKTQKPEMKMRGKDAKTNKS